MSIKKLKRPLVLLICAICTICTALTSFADETHTVTLQKIYYPESGVVKVVVSLDKNTGLSASTMNLQYDNSIFEIKKVADDSAVIANEGAKGLFIANDTQSENNIRVAYANLKPTNNATDFFTAYLQVKQNQEYNPAAITLSITEFFNVDSAEIPFHIADSTTQKDTDYKTEIPTAPSEINQVAQEEASSIHSEATPDGTPPAGQTTSAATSSVSAAQPDGETQPNPSAQQKNNWWIIAVILSFLLIAAVVAVILLRTRHTQQSPEKQPLAKEDSDNIEQKTAPDAAEATDMQNQQEQKTKSIDDSANESSK